MLDAICIPLPQREEYDDSGIDGNLCGLVILSAYRTGPDLVKSSPGSPRRGGGIFGDHSQEASSTNGEDDEDDEDDEYSGEVIYDLYLHYIELSHGRAPTDSSQKVFLTRIDPIDVQFTGSSLRREDDWIDRPKSFGGLPSQLKPRLHRDLSSVDSMLGTDVDNSINSSLLVCITWMSAGTLRVAQVDVSSLQGIVDIMSALSIAGNITQDNPHQIHIDESAKDSCALPIDTCLTSNDVVAVATVRGHPGVAIVKRSGEVICVNPPLPSRVSRPTRMTDPRDSPLIRPDVRSIGAVMKNFKLGDEASVKEFLLQIVRREEPALLNAGEGAKGLAILVSSIQVKPLAFISEEVQRISKELTDRSAEGQHWGDDDNDDDNTAYNSQDRTSFSNTNDVSGGGSSSRSSGTTVIAGGARASSETNDSYVKVKRRDVLCAGSFYLTHRLLSSKLESHSLLLDTINMVLAVILLSLSDLRTHTRTHIHAHT